MLSCDPFGTYRGVPKIFGLRPEAGVCQYLIEAPHRPVSSNTPAASCSLAAEYFFIRLSAVSRFLRRFCRTDPE